VTPPPSAPPAAPRPSGDGPRDPAPPRKKKPARRKRPASQGIDVGALLEEILASAALAGEGAPRYLFRCDSTVELPWEGGALSEILVGMLSLARRCAGEDGVVSAQVDPAPEDDAATGALVRIDFPLGPLTDGDLPSLLEEPFEGVPELAGRRACSPTSPAGCGSSFAFPAFPRPEMERATARKVLPRPPTAGARTIPSPEPWRPPAETRPPDPQATLETA